MIHLNKKKPQHPLCLCFIECKMCVSSLKISTNTAPKIQANGEGGHTLVIHSHGGNGSPGDFAEEWALEWPPLFTVLIYLTQRKKTLRKEVNKQLWTCMEGGRVNKRKDYKKKKRQVNRRINTRHFAYIFQINQTKGGLSRNKDGNGSTDI